MAKGKSKGSLHQILTAVIYVFLIGALGTYFLPIISVQLPVLGKKSWSVRDIVSAIPSTLPKAAGRPAEKKEKISVDYDFGDLLNEISPKAEAEKGKPQISGRIILGALVPLALALAYLLMVLSLLIAILKRNAAFFTTSFAAVVCTVYALLGTFMLAQAAEKAFSDSIAKVESSPFGAIAKSFVQEVHIRPEIGLYALAVLTVLILLAGLTRKNQPV
ncbi:MAG: hypothetical protein HY583_01380 [Candidatus Omnitrophica bacterium]|nr:hypothetical protein [Candidatus Omnitrophota bacterium]